MNTHLATPATLESSTLALGDVAPPWAGLRGASGEVALERFAEADLLALVFTGNGCPTAKAIEPRLMALQAAYRDRGLQVVAINANNPYLSPPDTYQQVVRRAAETGLPYPYLKDETGATARAYGAPVTPYVLLFDRQRRLRYRGRIDDARMPERVTRRDLEEAVKDLLAGREVQVPETQPFGCAIVW
ncbi:MAG TPA: redoxin domain-containing protein [Actinomycetota bacterium]|nr:redoxin domain-containing protein [Actinomycetota bacterium]